MALSVQFYKSQGFAFTHSQSSNFYDSFKNLNNSDDHKLLKRLQRNFDLPCDRNDICLAGLAVCCPCYIYTAECDSWLLHLIQCEDWNLTWVAFVVLVVVRALDGEDSWVGCNQLPLADQSFCYLTVQRGQVQVHSCCTHRHTNQQQGHRSSRSSPSRWLPQGVTSVHSGQRLQTRFN